MTGVVDIIARLMKPRAVAVIGASADPAKTAGRPIHFLRKHGFAGEILPVNPRADTIAGLQCYKDIASLPLTPDVGIILLGAANTEAAVRDLAARGTPAAILVAAGFGETGAEGRKRQDALAAAAGPMRLLGPNTIGLVNLVDRIPLSASGALDTERFAVGSIGVISQSGGVLGALLSRAAARGIGLSKLVTTGNEADLELADFVAYFAEDPDTTVIALYVESIRNPEKFRAAVARAAAAGKPVVAFKVGRSEGGARAAVSHTGALAGSDRTYDALFAQCGVIRAQRFSELLDIPAALATGRRLAGKRVAILTSTGGAATLVTDALGLNGLETPAPDAATAARLRELPIGDLAVLDRNPIDVTLAGLRPTLLRSALDILLASPGYDALVVIVGSSGVGNPGLIAEALRQSLSASDKPVLAYVSPHAPEAAALVTGTGVPAFAEPESCAAAFAAMHFARSFRALPAGAAVAPSGIALPSGPLDEAQAKSLFASFGIPCVRETIVRTPGEAAAAASALGGRVVLKVLSAALAHKSDVGGVAVGLTPETIGPRLVRMASDVAGHTGTTPGRFLVQAMVDSGTELILGLHRDPLGTAILLGRGGVDAELLRDTAMRLLTPGHALSEPEALALIHTLKSWPLLNGYRGRPLADIAALTAAIVSFSRLASQLGERIVDAEINPLFVCHAGAGVVAADAVVTLR